MLYVAALSLQVPPVIFAIIPNKISCTCNTLLVIIASTTPSILRGSVYFYRRCAGAITLLLEAVVHKAANSGSKQELLSFRDKIPSNSRHH